MNGYLVISVDTVVSVLSVKRFIPTVHRSAGRAKDKDNSSGWGDVVVVTIIAVK